jgi:PIN domain nuclease of toxin-antitoxin system
LRTDAPKLCVSEVVLDASALLAVLRRERGADVVEAVFPNTVMSTVNLGEVLSTLVDKGVAEQDGFAAILGLDLKFVSVDVGLTRASARLRENTRRAGLSLGDRVCLALAEQRGVPVLTADRAWAKLGLPLDIRVIR